MHPLLKKILDAPLGSDLSSGERYRLDKSLSTKLVTLLLICWIAIYSVDSAIHRINLYPLNNAIGFPNTYPLDSVIQREHYPKFEQPDPVVKPVAN